MKANLLTRYFFLVALSIAAFACTNTAPSAPTGNTTAAAHGGQASVQDHVSQKDVVKVAVGSPDHSTLVTAVKAADLVDVLSNAGPFTVFAPTNAAFDKLPAGTVEGLLKPDQKDALKNILEYHTYVGSLKIEYMQDGQSFEQVNGGKISISKKDGKTMVNGKATVLTSIPTSNGIIHVIDEVLLPE